MKYKGFDYWFRLREPIDYQDVLDYKKSLINGLVTEPLFRQNLKTLRTEQFNKDTKNWDIREDI